MVRAMETLSTVQEVVDALGGEEAVSELAGVKVRTIHQWKFRKKLPSDKFIIISRVLEEQRKEAAPSLWGFIEPEAAQ